MDNINFSKINETLSNHFSLSSKTENGKNVLVVSAPANPASVEQSFDVKADLGSLSKTYKIRQKEGEKDKTYFSINIRGAFNIIESLTKFNVYSPFEIVGSRSGDYIADNRSTLLPTSVWSQSGKTDEQYDYISEINCNVDDENRTYSSFGIKTCNMRIRRIDESVGRHYKQLTITIKNLSTNKTVSRLYTFYYTVADDNSILFDNATSSLNVVLKSSEWLGEVEEEELNIPPFVLNLVFIGIKL